MICQEGSASVYSGDGIFDFKEGDTAIIPAGIVHKVVNSYSDVMRVIGIFSTSTPAGVCGEEGNTFS